MSLARELEALAALLEADAKKKSPLRKILPVLGFLGFDKYGNGVGPEDIEPGDELYLQRAHDPAAGSLSKNPLGSPFARALEWLAAGTSGEIAAVMYEKRWQTDGNPCPVCDENALAGWIPADDDFPSGDDEPPNHPSCKCDLITRYGEGE